MRFELSPENDDPFVPIDMWVFKIDQDELPEWIDVYKRQGQTAG